MHEVQANELALEGPLLIQSDQQVLKPLRRDAISLFD